MGLLSEAHRQDEEGDPQQSTGGTPHPAHQTDGTEALWRPPHPGDEEGASQQSTGGMPHSTHQTDGADAMWRLPHSVDLVITTGIAGGLISPKRAFILASLKGVFK